ncbi:MAG: DUF123 domain-containing protein [Candidatus Bathyarchaeia archaeon]
MRGTYVLLLRVTEPFRTEVGALGPRSFPAGYYCYVGSAVGKRMTIERRVGRHRRVKDGEETPLRWHIDYVLREPRVKIEAVFSLKGSRRECEVAEFISARGIPLKGLGSSDCRCESHLFRVNGKELPLTLEKLGFIETTAL